jgi:hypothetical protein
VGEFEKIVGGETNAPLADMLFKQGAILFAKSNMHELDTARVKLRGPLPHTYRQERST